jgi:hypothetical protein
MVLSTGMTGCSGSDKRKKTKYNETEAPENKEVKNVVYTKYGIPLPVELFTYMVKEEIPYNVDLLLSTHTKEKYAKETKQAMILGVYSADMAYCSSYGRQQEVLSYFSTASKIADRLDISEGFSFESIERIANNVQKADSLSAIAEEMYWRTCNYLDENEKNNILPFVVYGGWVESQYLTIASNDLKSTKDIIVEQKQGLLNLIRYFLDVTVESSAFYYSGDIKKIVMRLDNIKNVYEKIPGKDIDPQLYKDISVKITSMRNELIDPRADL